MKLSTSQFAKWSAIATLMLAGIWPLLCHLQNRFDDGSGKFSVFDFLAMGVALLTLASLQVCIVALILLRLEKKGKK